MLVPLRWREDRGEIMNAEKLIAEAQSLPLEERVAVVDTLLRSLNPPDSDIDARWVEVAQQRWEELRSGQVKAIPGEEVFARIWGRLSR